MQAFGVSKSKGLTIRILQAMRATRSKVSHSARPIPEISLVPAIPARFVTESGGTSGAVVWIRRNQLLGAEVVVEDVVVVDGHGLDVVDQEAVVEVAFGLGVADREGHAVGVGYTGGPARGEAGYAGVLRVVVGCLVVEAHDAAGCGMVWGSRGGGDGRYGSG